MFNDNVSEIPLSIDGRTIDQVGTHVNMGWYPGAPAERVEISYIFLFLLCLLNIVPVHPPPCILYSPPNQLAQEKIYRPLSWKLGNYLTTFVISEQELWIYQQVKIGNKFVL